MRSIFLSTSYSTVATTSEPSTTPLTNGLRRSSAAAISYSLSYSFSNTGDTLMPTMWLKMLFIRSVISITALAKGCKRAIDSATYSRRGSASFTIGTPRRAEKDVGRSTPPISCRNNANASSRTLSDNRSKRKLFFRISSWTVRPFHACRTRNPRMSMPVDISPGVAGVA